MGDESHKLEEVVLMWTHIRIRKETAQKLKELGKKGETYDDVINRLIKEYEKITKQ